MARGDGLHAVGQEVGDRLGEIVEEIKPRLRGWLHTGTVPLSLAAGIVLVALAPPGEARGGAIVFAITSVLLFSLSAVYHTPSWSIRVHDLLQRVDHANIFMLIAGTYTPFALLLLDDHDATVLLTIVWVSAVFGMAFRLLWFDAPRWLYVPTYVALGWAAMFWLGDFAASGQIAVLVLMLVGGLLYSLGGLVYGLKRPDPVPGWFGFHEVFHTFTVAAFVVHYVGISIATYSV
ncbi:MAG: hemolysin III family protein [Nocardioidaceae bacterium]|jgi:hemolysin III|nr:hemolysin III family protein [Nocardioidaceae bacterium]